MTTKQSAGPTVDGVEEISVATLLDLLLVNHQGREFAIVDVRERGEQAEDGHLIHSVPLPLGQLEQLAPRLLPRQDTLVVVVDATGSDKAQAAAARLRELGHTAVTVLVGGVSAWHQAGHEIYTGVCAYSKAFGEYVEHEYGTPAISAEELKARLDAGDNILLVDGRSQEEFIGFSIPSAYSVPNAELPYRIHGLLPDDETLVVVNCAGRTRSIIGAQTLINAGTGNKVVSLRNGTMDWLKHGFALQSGQLRVPPAPSQTHLAQARDATERLTQRYGIDWIDAGDLAHLQRRDLTLYVFDVRSRQEYEAGHLPGAQWAEGGELVQWLDRHVAVRNAHVVLVDDETGTRAAITASWLLQLNIAHVHALRADAAARSATGASPSRSSASPPASFARWDPARVRQALQNDTILLVDLATSKEFAQGHIQGAVFRQRSALNALELTEALAGRTLVLTSPDGVLAGWTAHDLRASFPDVVVLDGGTQGWQAAGLELTSGETAELHGVRDREPSPYETEDRFAAFDAYLAWELELLRKIGNDPSVRYRKFPASHTGRVPPGSPEQTGETAGPWQAHQAPDKWEALFSDIAASAVARENSGAAPHDEVRKLLQHGFGALHLSRDIGGGGLSYRELFALVIRLAAADANIAHIFRNHYAFVNGLLAHADQAKADRWLQRAVQGDLFANGVTDKVRPRDASGLAVDLSRFATTLSREAGTLVLHGDKQYATGSVYADWLAVQATSEENGQTFTVVVPTDAPGVEVIDDWAGFGQRFTASGSVVLNQVQINDDAQFLIRDRARPGAEYSSSIAQLFLTAIIAGIVQASLDEARALVRTRKQNLYFAPSVNPAEDPLLLQTLGQLATNAFAARAIILQAAEDFDHAARLPLAQRTAANHASALSAAKAKVAIDALGTASATLLFDVGGASATHRERQLDRHWRNARTISTHNPALYKALAIGAHEARGAPLPNQGFF